MSLRRSVEKGRAERPPVLAPGQDLFDAQRAGFDAQGLRRRGPGPVRDSPAEIRPDSGNLEMRLQPAALPGDAPGTPPQAGQEVPQPGVVVIDRKQRVRPVPPHRSRVRAPFEAAAEKGLPETAIERFLVRLEDDRQCRSEVRPQRGQHTSDGGVGLRGAAAMSRLVLGPSPVLEGGHTTLAPQRSGGGRDDEQSPALNQDGDGHRLVSVRLERLQLVELEGTSETDPGKPVRLKQRGLTGEPGEAPLHRAPGDLQDARRLAQSDARHEKAQTGRIDRWLLLAPVGSKGLPGEAASAPAAAKARHRMVTTEGMIKPIAHEEPWRGSTMKITLTSGTAGRREHGVSL